MAGAKGGVHLLAAAPPVLEAAAVRLGAAWPPYVPPDAEPERSFALEKGLPLWEAGADGSFQFHCGNRLPPVGWSQMLTNGDFGWMVDETGCGHLWRGNARECPLTPWNNDPLAVGGTERFVLRAEGEERSLFADGDGLPCTVTYAPGFARWEKTWGERRVRTTAFVPADRRSGCCCWSWRGALPAGAPVKRQRRDTLHAGGRAGALHRRGSGGAGGGPRSGPEVAGTHGDALEPHGLRAESAHARPGAGPLPERLVPVPGDRLPPAGPDLPLSERRGLRVPGPAPGRMRHTAHRRRVCQGAAAARLRPSVPGGGCDALVARDRWRGGQRRAHPYQRRPLVAAVCAVRVPGAAGGLGHFGGTGPLPGVPAPASGGAGAL